MRLRDQARQWLRELFVWDQSEKQHLVRAAMAKGLGLMPEEYVRPFPGSSVVTNITEAVRGGSLRRLPAILAGLALGLMAAATGWVVWSYRPGMLPIQQTVEPAGWQWQLEIKGKDGEWKPVGDPVRVQQGVR